MGNRAIINFKDDNEKAPFSIYLHWNGGKESVYAFYNATYDFFMKDGGIDFSYFQARFLQVVGHFFGGADSLGVLPYTTASHGDNGVYTIDVSEELPRLEHEQYLGIYTQCLEYLQSTTYKARKQAVKDKNNHA